MPALNVDPEGLQSAGRQSRTLADVLAASSPPTSSGTGAGGQDTVGAVQAVNAAIDRSRQAQAAQLNHQAGSLQAAGTKYENTDGTAAGDIERTL